MTERDPLEALFDETAAQPTAAQLARMEARAADIDGRAPWWRMPAIGLALGALGAAIALVVLRPVETVEIGVPPADRELVATESAEELELAIGTYFDAGLYEDGVGVDVLYDAPDDG